jgi:ATP-dependent Lon protease
MSEHHAIELARCCPCGTWSSTRTWCCPCLWSGAFHRGARERHGQRQAGAARSAAQRGVEDDPGADDIYQVGTVSNILQLLKLPDGTIKVLVEGASALRSTTSTTRVTSRPPGFARSKAMSPRAKRRGVLLRTTTSHFEKYVNLSKKVPAEVLTSLTGIDEPGRLADTIAAHMGVDLEEKQRILEMSIGAGSPGAPDGPDGR